MKRIENLALGLMILMTATGTAFAMMGGPGMGGGMGGGHMDGGKGYGMMGAGGMLSGMMGNTMSHGYLDILNPLDTPEEARGAIQAFISSSNSSLQISELWEYGTAYIAELSDTSGAKAFDLIADKFTGAVMPEMGLSMMMNASYGKGLYKMPNMGKSLSLTPEQAKDIAQDFVNKNGLAYNLESPETYPGYYKFHTKDSTGKFGLDIMISGYDGGIWMNTPLGLPAARY